MPPSSVSKVTGDTTAPTLFTALVDGTKLTPTYGETLDEFSTPVPRQLDLPNCRIASPKAKWLPQIKCYRKIGGSHVGGGISKMAKRVLLATLRDRYRSSAKKDKSRILDEFIAVTGHHRKHGIRLLRQLEDDQEAPCPTRDRRIYDDAVREAVIVIWEAADRICGKRLKAAMPHLVESMERHGHLALDPEVRDRLLAASAATLDRLLKPIRPMTGSRRRPRRRRSLGKRVPVRTYNDWNGPPPGYLEIDLVLHSGGPRSGSFIHSLVATDICTGWTEAVPLLARSSP